MADEKRTKIIIPRDGIMTGQHQVRGLDTAITNKIIDALGGKKTIIRASHVEPGSGLLARAIEWLYSNCTGCVKVLEGFGAPLVIDDEYRNKWFADLLPVDGPVLGPFDDRHAALAAEEAWLHEHHIPVCQPCRAAPTDRGAPNTQQLSAARYLPTTDPNVIVNLDFAGLDQQVLDHYRRIVADAVVVEGFREQPVDNARSGDWTLDGDNWTAMVALTDGSRYNVALTFQEGVAAIKHFRCAEVT